MSLSIVEAVSTHRDAECLAASQDVLDWLHPAISASDGTAACGSAAAGAFEMLALQAHPPVVALSVAQGQAFSKMLSVLSPGGGKPLRPGREQVNLVVVPTA
ncbi:MAG TPA: hypothetical protein PKV56_16410, partial [Burkholderiaceae bacterium]|nr:hypothetical protein [Burkholderiaceae bacterium]